MLKLRKYLKPFIISVLLAIMLLFIQAICDLNLPNYMSDIVNVGIQQEGIESGVPEAISQTGFELIKLLMSDEAADLLGENYLLTDLRVPAEGGKTLADIYPHADDKVYVVKEGVDEQTKDEIANAFGVSVMTFANVMLSMSETKSVPYGGDASEGIDEQDLSGIDMKSLYSFAPVIRMLPGEKLADARVKAAENDPATLTQAAIKLVSAFNKELGVNAEAHQRNYIMKTGLFMLLITFIGGMATVLVSFICSRVSAGVARNLRNAVFEKVERFSNAEFDKFSTASLITRSTNDVTQIQMFLMIGIRMICYAPIMGIGGIVMAVNKSPSMSWVIALAVIIIICLMVVVFSIVTPKFKLMQKFIDRINLVAREALNGLMVIRAFGTSGFEKKRFDDANKDLSATNLFVHRTMAFMMPSVMLIMNGITILIVWVGAHQIAQSSIQVGDMMAFMQYAMQVIFSFLMVSMMFFFIPRAAVSAQRLNEVLDTEPGIKDPKSPKKMLDRQKGIVEFKNVSYRYEGAELDAIENISFIAKPGETTAFIGATGSGKTTIVNLILRFYDATAGEVSVGGVNVKELLQGELRSRIGYIPQKSVLMSGTIESNIKYGNDSLGEEEVRKIAEIAQASDFINEKEGGFSSEISQGGTNVSGGQKQRLSIARALAVSPEIYIFDDSLSALDFKTDAALRKAFNENTPGSTDIIVAQRVSTIMNADCIYVIDNGKIAGSGTHKELLKSCPEYREIVSSQMGEEAAGNE